MSTLIVEGTTAVDLIPLGRRIAEIMKEKGMAFSQTATAKRLGIGRETFRLMLSGGREIYTFELEKIAMELKVSVQRIMQEDIKNLDKELDDLLSEMSSAEQSIKLAQQLSETALGMTEKCIYFRKLGRAFFYNGQYDDAHKILLDAHQLAQQIQEKYGETKLLYDVLFNVIETYAARKDFANASQILESIEVTFVPTPHRLAAIFSLHTKIKESMNDLEEARILAYKALDYAEKSGKEILIGQVANNVAHFEYKLRNYSSSKMYLEKAIAALESAKQFQVIAKKEFAKTLLKLQENRSAIEIIEATLQESVLHNNIELNGKLLLLLSKATDETSHAEFVLEQERFGVHVRSLACKFLMEYYKHNNDSLMFMHYYKIAEKFSKIFSDFLDEGDL